MPRLVQLLPVSLQWVVLIANLSMQKTHCEKSARGNKLATSYARANLFLLRSSKKIPPTVPKLRHRLVPMLAHHRPSALEHCVSAWGSQNTLQDVMAVSQYTRELPCHEPDSWMSSRGFQQPLTLSDASVRQCPTTLSLVSLSSPPESL